MEVLKKLKLLAFQYTAPSPSFSFRRRKILRRFLRSPFSYRRRRRHMDLSKEASVKKKGMISSHSLKDLLVKSPPSSPVLLGGGGDGGAWRRIGPDGLCEPGHRSGVVVRRLGFAGLRHRLLRPAWRPKLVAIPELRTEDEELLL